MMPDDQHAKSNPTARLQQLTAAAMAGELSADELRELDELLLTSDTALKSFLKTCQLDADLRFHTHAALSGRRAMERLPELTAPSPKAGPSRGIPARRWFAGLAASLLVALFGWWTASYWQEIPAERQPQPIARLSESEGARWLGDDGPRVGHEFVEGDSVYLTKGRARISMSSGAEVVLRSPCFVTLAAANRVQLEEGVVTAQVAEWGHGFTVVTNAMNVVDLGTKFAVAASAHGVSEAHVLDGQVRIQPLGTTSANRRSMLLSGGEALRVESERKVATRLKADPQRYDAEMGDLPPLKPILIHNTGKGLVSGDEDPHWRISAGPKCTAYDGPQFAVVCDADVRYLANDRERSQWLSVTNPVRPGVPPSTEFTFETTFDLAGYDVSTVTIAAQVIADNGIRAVRVNGQPLPLVSWNLNEPYQLFNRFELIEIREHLVPGVNRVEFDVWNGVDRAIAAAPNPIAIRVEWQAYGRPLQSSIGDTAATPASDQPNQSTPLALWRHAGPNLVID
jgi:ferric-dicitrate binding protein FerR (iron transport regulator)